MKTKPIRMFLVVSLLTMGLLVATPTPAFACHIEVGGDADCNGFSGWAKNYMGETVIFEWKVELYQGGVRVDLQEGQSGQIPHGGTYSFSGTWTHTPMCGDFHVKGWVGAYNLNNELIAQDSAEGDLHCDDCPPDGSIGDYVWHDSFHSRAHQVDGIQDAGEPGLEGVLVELYKDGGKVGEDTTNASGYYEFTGLSAGTYTVKVADSNFASGGVLEGWRASPANKGDDAKDSDGHETTHEVTVTLAAGETDNTIDFGFFYPCVDLEKTGPASVGLGETITYTFRVENCGDVVLHGGVSVYDPLINPDGDHKIGWSVVWPGNVYEFDRTYAPDQDDCGELVNTATAIGHPKHAYGYVADVTDQDSWTVQVRCSSLGDYVWWDEDGEGDQDEAADHGLDGVIVELYSGDCPPAGASSATDTTSGGGYYYFGNLEAGQYCVKLADSNFESGGALYNYRALTVQDAAGIPDDQDSDFDPTNHTVSVTLAVGEENLTIDAGVEYTGPPTVVTLSSFAARSSTGGSVSPLWLGLAGLTVLAAGTLFWTKRRAG